MAIARLGVARVLPSHTMIEGPRPIVHGLALQDALYCEECPTVMTNSKAMRAHHLGQHKDIPTPRTWKKCQAQRLKPQGNGHLRRLWRVIGDVEVMDEDDDALEILLSDLNKELENIILPDDHRLISPWLQTTHWHEYLATRGQDMSVKDLQHLISLPQADETDLGGLHTAVKNYFEEALSILDTMSELVLQRINSPDPVK